MSSQSIALDRGILDVRKIFWFIVAFEAVALNVILWGDLMFNVFFWSIIVVPLFLLMIPLEPVLGVPLMLIATGMDYLGRIGEKQYLFTLTYFHIVMVITFLSVFLHTFLRQRKKIPASSLWMPFFAFLVVMAVSIIVTPMFREGFMEVVRLFVLGMMGLAIILCVDSKLRVKIVVWSFIIVPTAVSIRTIYEIATEGAFYQAQVIQMATQMGIKVYRSTGTFLNPNELAVFIMVGVLAGFALLFMKNQKLIVKLFIALCIGLTGIALIATFSRGGWLATFIGVFVIILLQRRWSYFFIFAGIGIIALAILSITHPEIILSSFDRFASIFDPMSEASSSSRLSLAKSGIWMWQDHPLLGVGAGGYEYYIYDYKDPYMPQELTHVVLAHTIQIKILAEEGLIGLTVATWFFFTVLFEGIRSLKSIEDELLKCAQIGFVGMFVGFMIYFSVNSDMFNNIYWINIGMIYAIPLVNKQVMKYRSKGDPPLASG